MYNSIKHYKIPFHECLIVTNSNYTDYVPKTIEVIIQSINFFKDKEAVLPWLEGQLLKRHEITELVVDVYPCGFYGELTKLNTLKIKKTLLARLLKPHYFKRNTSKPAYDKLIVVEKGLDITLYCAEEIEFINLQLDIHYNTEKLKTIYPFFYIMHSGPSLEVLNLYKLAKTYRVNNEHIYIQTFCDLNELSQEKNTTIIYLEKPYLELIEKSTTIFTGVGYNTFWSTKNYRNKQVMMPFIRGYDDQFMRKRVSYRN